MTPLMIYDFRVLSFLILGGVQKLPEPVQVSGLGTPEDNQRVAYIKACWAMVLNRGPNCIDYEPHTAVVVDDNGTNPPYWRRELFPAYKGNRGQKPDLFYSVAQIGLDYINSNSSPLHYLTVPGYEADDLAGALVYIKRQHQKLPDGDPAIANRPIGLYTVDSDWLQLVGNGVTWYNSGPWEPRVRGASEAIVWAKKRLKVSISRPEQIVDTKMKQGDKSDNLPPGSPRYMIDLMNSHPKYHLKNNEQIWRQLYLVLNDQIPNQTLSHFEKAKNFIMAKGYSLPV
jgi:hypothetical protein